MDIVGPGADKLTISGNDSSRIFRLTTCPKTLPVSISGLRLTHGHAARGGALYVYNCMAKIAAVEVSASSADIGGGGIYAFGSDLAIDHSKLSGNSAQYGGGLSVGHTTGSVVSSTISGNTATYQGGGIVIHDSYLVVDYSSVSGNVIPSPPGGLIAQRGGGVLADTATLLMQNSTVANNYAYGGGGGITFADAYSGDHSALYTATIAGNGTCCYEAGNGTRLRHRRQQFQPRR
jgi:parallel beta-helix repeat protein